MFPDDFYRRTAAVTGRPQETLDFKTRVVGRSGSRLGYLAAICVN
jgi:hypothetical protein